jgi:hypothetical protein
MRRVMVRYKVKPDRAEENAALVRAVYEELAEARPPGFRYATFRLEDGVSFVHVSSQEAEESPLSKSRAFAAFQNGIAERCDEPPVLAELQEVGSYEFFSA